MHSVVAFLEGHFLGARALSRDEVVDLRQPEALVENLNVGNDLAGLHEVNAGQ